MTLGPSQGQAVELRKSRILIGREIENDIVLGQDVKVSRQHVELVVDNQNVVFRNLNPKNPVAIDGEIVERLSLRPGARVRLGQSELVIQFQSPQASPPALKIAASSPQVKPVQSMQSTNSAGGRSVAPTSQRGPGLAVVQGGVAPASFGGPAQIPAGKPYASQSAMPIWGQRKYQIGAGVVVVVLFLLFSSNEKALQKKTRPQLRDSAQVEASIQAAKTSAEEKRGLNEKKGKDTIQYRIAQEHYVRGFRDYRQGQFVRAMESFGAALSFFPNHEMARKYYSLARRKFDEEVQYNLRQGKRYYGIKNYRLCMAFFANVIKMKKEPQDPVRREALQYYEECELRFKGKF